jgi:hypothetical protein
MQGQEKRSFYVQRIGQRIGNEGRIGNRRTGVDTQNLYVSNFR